MRNVVKTNCKNKNNVLDYFSNNPFVLNKEGYDNFIKCMIRAAEDGKLPIMLEPDKPERITVAAPVFEDSATAFTNL